MGPVGTGFMLFGLTGFVYFLCVACNDGGWPELTWRPSLPELTEAWSWQAFAVVSGWILFQSVLYYVAPGKWVKGVKLQDGTQLEYPINGKADFPHTEYCITCIPRSLFCPAHHGCKPCAHAHVSCALDLVGR